MIQHPHEYHYSKATLDSLSFHARRLLIRLRSGAFKRNQTWIELSPEYLANVAECHPTQTEELVSELILAGLIHTNTDSRNTRYHFQAQI